MNATGPDLVLTNAVVRFGGLVAVNGVSLTAKSGAVTGLIGPNGAGKTTIFNACSGTVELTAGTVQLGQKSLRGCSSAKRARLGLGRTFQRMELVESMSVAENVSLGPEGLCCARKPWSQVFGSRAERKHIQSRTADAIERCGIRELAGQTVGNLSTGQRRLVELARAIASPFRFLLLDEPSSGLDVGETEHFAHVLEQFVADTGTGVLLVEHDMALVSTTCSYIYVLDFGTLIFAGDTNTVLTSDIVKAAYLGSDAVDGERSDSVSVVADSAEPSSGRVRRA
jgi:ABC-type branched-subunit amino acid transport system ATPase component